MLYNARNEAIKFYDDYSSIMSEAKYRATKGKGLKILTRKQMLKRLSIALAQELNKYITTFDYIDKILVV